jgi:hypothetical protein
LTNICRAAAVSGIPSILVELEMPREQIVQRLATDLDYDRKLQHQRSIAYTNLRNGKVGDAEFQRLFAVTQSMASLPLEIYEAAGMTAHEIVALLERAISKHKTMGVICVDYLQIIKAGNRYAGSKVNEVTEISNALMQFAKRVKWPVVVGSQLNRAIEQRQEKRPTLADLRESGAIEQDADIVIGLHRPAYYVEQKRPANGKFDPAYQGWAADWNAAKNDLEIAVMKNRNGPPAVCNVHVDIFSGSIRNRPGDEADTVGDDYYPGGLRRMKTIRPKNWAEFQHYKDRSPGWIKLHKRLLDDFEFQTLPIASRALAPMLWLLASEYENAEIPGDTRKIAYRLRMTLEELSVSFEPLVRSGFFEIIGEDEIAASKTLAECLPDACLEKEIQVTSLEEKETPPPAAGLGTSKKSVTEPSLPDWVPSESWQAFVEMRGKIRAPLTNRAKNLAIAELEKLKNDGHKPQSVLEQSVMRSWRGLFPVDAKPVGQKPPDAFEPTDEHGWRNRLDSFRKFQVWPAKWGGTKPGDDPRHPAWLGATQ